MARFTDTFETLNERWTPLVGSLEVSSGALRGMELGILRWNLFQFVQLLGEGSGVRRFARCPDGSLVAGTESTGCVYRSTDNGQTWTFIQRLGTNVNVGSFAQCPDGSMLAGTANSGEVYRSVDNGQAWTLVQRLGSAKRVGAIAQCPDGSMIAGTGGGGEAQIYRSTDNGQSWTFVQALGSETATESLCRCADGSMIAGTSPNQHIYRSTDNGQTWTFEQELKSGPDDKLVLSLVQCPDGSMLAGTAELSNVYRSTDNGQTWSLIQKIGDVNGYYLFTFFVCSDESVLAGIYDWARAYRSTDNGQTWSLVQRIEGKSHLYHFAQCPDGGILAGTRPNAAVYKLGHVAATLADWPSPNFVATLAHISPTTSAIPFGIIFRYIDAGNYWEIRLHPNTGGNDLQIIQVTNGTETVRAQADVDWTSGQIDELEVTAVDQSISTRYRKYGESGWSTGPSYSPATQGETSATLGVILYDTDVGRLDLFDIYSYIREGDASGTGAGIGSASSSAIRIPATVIGDGTGEGAASSMAIRISPVSTGEGTGESESSSMAIRMSPDTIGYGIGESESSAIRWMPIHDVEEIGVTMRVNPEIRVQVGG